jgi:hypothetical protein
VYTDNGAVTSDSPVFVGTNKFYKNEKTTRDVSFELDNKIEDSFVISSPISTEILFD